MGSMSPLNILSAGLQGVGGILETALPVISAASSLTKQVQDFGRDPAADARKAAADNLAAQQTLAMAQLQAQQGLSEQQAAQDALQAQATIAAEAASADAARRAALKRAVARQKVSLASQGISAADNGSAEAILLGLFQESETEKAQREKLDGLRTQALGEELNQKKAINVLQRAQLAEKQNLERALRG